MPSYGRPDVPLNDEQLRKLPYHEKPADALDVAREITNLASLVAGIIVAGMAPYGRYSADIGAKKVAEMLEDATKEPGQSVVVQQARVALALESWAGEAGGFLLKTAMEAMPALIGESFVAIHNEAHGTPTEPDPEPERHLFVVNPEGTAEDRGHPSG